jgi:hypothetical protein
MRALAVSLVLVYHLWPRFLIGGFTGVDVCAEARGSTPSQVMGYGQFPSASATRSAKYACPASLG